MIPLIREIIESTEAPVDVFVEPFAGGSSVSLQLAGSANVSQVLIADRDPLIYAFWRVATEDADWLVEQVQSIEVSLEVWDKMRETNPKSLRDRALKCLFLNRTSFSGIMHEQAGPLGGRSQASRKIDCRFPRGRLVHRIRQVEALAEDGRILGVWPFDYHTTVQEVRNLSRSLSKFFFFDPPFYAKSQKLYRFSFTPEDHKDLSRVLRRMRLPFVLSYDDHPEVRQLYNGSSRPTVVNKEYRAAASKSRRMTNELIVTNVKTWNSSAT